MELRDNNTRKLTSGLRRPFGVAGNSLCAVSVYITPYSCIESWAGETSPVQVNQTGCCVVEFTVASALAFSWRCQRLFAT